MTIWIRFKASSLNVLYHYLSTRDNTIDRHGGISFDDLKSFSSWSFTLSGLEIRVGDLLEALQLEQTISTSISEARNSRRTHLNFEASDLQDHTFEKHGGINFDDLDSF